jgi:hypothetical protein
MPSNNVEKKKEIGKTRGMKEKNVYMKREAKNRYKCLSAFNDMCYVGVKIVTKQISN